MFRLNILKPLVEKKLSTSSNYIFRRCLRKQSNGAGKNQNLKTTNQTGETSQLKQVNNSTAKQTNSHRVSNEDIKDQPKSKLKQYLSFPTNYPNINLQEWNQFYQNLEESLMKQIKESNRRRFRIILVGTIVSLVTIFFVFKDKIRQKITHHTADIAKETLENESLKIQTQELATAVVQTILNDKEVTAHAASFLREASAVPETQEALLKLTMHVLQHPDSLREVSALLKLTIQQLSNDPEVLDSISSLLSEALQQPEFKKSLMELFVTLSKDPQILAAFLDLAQDVMLRPEMAQAASGLLTESSLTVLSDEKIVSQSREFVGEVFGDAKLQREGGDALLNSVSLALQPSMYRVLGGFLLVGSATLAKLILSPF